MTVMTKQELIQLATNMRAVTSKVYYLLQSTYCHPFLEFNGLMSKYVDLCLQEAERGVDFTTHSTHNESGMPMMEHDVHYLAEKFDCIFGPSLRANPRLWKIFKDKIERG